MCEKGEKKAEAGGTSASRDSRRETVTRRRGVCLFLQDLLQSCSRGGRGIVEDMCYERLRAKAGVN